MSTVACRWIGLETSSRKKRHGYADIPDALLPATTTTTTTTTRDLTTKVSRQTQWKQSKKWIWSAFGFFGFVWAMYYSNGSSGATPLSSSSLLSLSLDSTTPIAITATSTATTTSTSTGTMTTTVAGLTVPPKPPSETQPTLLSIFDPELNRYADSKTNPLYEQLKAAFQFNNINNNIDMNKSRKLVEKRHPSKLHLDKTHLSKFEEDDDITISWTFNNIMDDDILVLYCRMDYILSTRHSKKDHPGLTSKWNEFRNGFLDAATIGQVRATNQRHCQQLQQQTQHDDQVPSNCDQQNSWYIPHFPIVRQDVCQFRLYSSTILSTSSLATATAATSFNSTSVPEQEEVHATGDSNTTVSRDATTILLAVSDPFYLYSKETPTAIHLALGSNPSSMVVHFTTGYNENDHNNNNDANAEKVKDIIPVVRYNVMNKNEKHNNRHEQLKWIMQTGRTVGTYAPNDLCQAPANLTEAGKFYPPGYFHVVELLDLEPNTNYHYQVGLVRKKQSSKHSSSSSSSTSTSSNTKTWIDDTSTIWSNKYTFQSPPLIPTTSHATLETPPFSYVVYGDQGCPLDGWIEASKWIQGMVQRELLLPELHSKGKTSPGQRATSKHQTSMQNRITSIHHFGDLSYANGAAHIWDEWFRLISPIAASVPIMIGVGNHEYDHRDGGTNGKDPSGVTTPNGYMPIWGNYKDDSGGECGVPTAKRFQMPQSELHGLSTTNDPMDYNYNNSALVRSNGVFWYSYNVATVHTVVLSSEHDCSVGSPQYLWLEANLNEVDRTTTPWLIVEIHRPLYEQDGGGSNIGTDGEQEEADEYTLLDPWRDENVLVGQMIRKSLEPLLVKYQVDLVLTGHYHEYYRTCDGLVNSTCSENLGMNTGNSTIKNENSRDTSGPIHITIGSAGGTMLGGKGRTIARVIQMEDSTTTTNMDEKIAPWTKTWIQGIFGYGRITVVNATALHFEFVRHGTMQDPNGGQVLDDVWINRNYPRRR